MYHLKIKSKEKFTGIVLLTWMFVLTFSISGISSACSINNPSRFEISNPVSMTAVSYFPAVNIYNCCSRTMAKVSSKSYYYINSSEELNLKFSAKRFYVLPHGIFENFQKSLTVKTADITLEQALPVPDIPISTSALLI